MRKKRKRYWWASFAVYQQANNAWRLTDTVSTKHPFLLAEEWGDHAVYGAPTLIGWREITRAEYRLHGEHDPDA